MKCLKGGDVQKIGKGNACPNKGEEREPVCRRVDGWLAILRVP
jgi:hypothetical protein